jgi:hypothetical protein
LRSPRFGQPIARIAIELAGSPDVEVEAVQATPNVVTAEADTVPASLASSRKSANCSPGSPIESVIHITPPMLDDQSLEDGPTRKMSP